MTYNEKNLFVFPVLKNLRVSLTLTTFRVLCLQSIHMLAEINQLTERNNWNILVGQTNILMNAFKDMIAGHPSSVRGSKGGRNSISGMYPKRYTWRFASNRLFIVHTERPLAFPVKMADARDLQFHSGIQWYKRLIFTGNTGIGERISLVIYSVNVFLSYGDFCLAGRSDWTIACRRITWLLFWQPCMCFYKRSTRKLITNKLLLLPPKRSLYLNSGGPVVLPHTK